jgi:hypothetical protein
VFPPSGEGGDVNSVGSLRKNYPLTLDWLVLSNGHNRVVVSIPSPEDGNRSGFSDVVFFSYLEFQTMYEVLYHRQNPLDSTYIYSEV